MCRWWSGCTDSWRAQSGRLRRTKPRDWCSSGRWDAGPSDNLWSERGRGRDEQRGVRRRRRRRMVGPIRRFGRYRPVFCSRIKGSIQRDLSLRLPPFLSEPHNKTPSVFSPVDSMRIFPPRKKKKIKSFSLSLSLFV